MWTEDAGDENVFTSAADNVRHEAKRQVPDQWGCQRSILSNTGSVVLLAAITVLFAGVLPFVAFRDAMLRSSNGAPSSAPAASEDSAAAVRLSQQGPVTFDLAEAHATDRHEGHAQSSPLPHRRFIEPVKIPNHRVARLEKERGAHRLQHAAAAAPDELLPQVMEHSRPCSSAACEREALNVSQQLDESVSPCDDFYTHVCGRWARQVAVPGGSARVSVDTLTQDLLTHLVDGAFRRYSEDLGRVTDLYNECRSHKSGDFERALFDEITREFGNVSWFLSIRTMASHLRKSVWRLFRDVGDTQLSTNVGVFYRTINEPALFSIKPTTDSDFPNETLVSIGLPTLAALSFPDSPERSNYSYVSEAMDAILGQSELTRGVEVNVLNVERALARAMSAHGVAEPPRLVQVAELPKGGKLKWDALFSAMMAEPATNFSSAYVSVDSVRYLSALQEALQELHDVEIVAYLGFRAKLALAPLIMDKKQLDLLGALAVSRVPEWHPALTREHYCVRFFEKLEPALSLYAARTDIEAALRHLPTAPLVEAVKKAVLEEVATLFPEPFANNVVGALRAAKWSALMPDWVRAGNARTKYVEYFYPTVERAPVHQQFSLLIKLKNANQYQRYLTGIFVDAPWAGSVRGTTAAVGEGRVDIPPGAFDFFRADAAEPSLSALQVARLAPRVASSVYQSVFASAFDFLYRTGHQKSWVLLDDARECVSNQFGALNASNTTLRSDRASWALLAHVLSAAPSFKAFLAILDGDLYLKGLEGFSSEKLYFVYYALNYCEANDDEFLARMLEAGSEPPAWHIVNGALRNFQGFADTFNCSVGSFMNPEEKCVAWTF